MTGSPKTMFFFGLATGVGAMAIVSLLVILSLLMSGKAFAAETKVNAPVATAPTAPVAPDEPLPPAGPVPEVDDEDHIRGNKDAKVTLIEYSDFECPFCLRHLDTVDQILEAYPNDVRLVYRHYPLSFHPEAQKAAEASECAAEQGKFWEMHDAIFAANAAGTMSVTKWKEIAATLKLNTSKFNDCLDTGKMASKVNEDLQEGSVAGVTGTPATFVNGSLVSGAVPFAQFDGFVKQAGATR
ncbi:MAG: hypothetical protein RL141_290 [Candidatus Parcubacteria bacterium]